MGEIIGDENGREVLRWIRERLTKLSLNTAFTLGPCFF
jgi:hypothetical protein